MIKTSKGQRYILSILSGLLMVFSFPYTGSFTPVIFIAWIPLLFVESSISKNRYRSSKVFIHSYITFLIYNIGTTWWIWNASPGGAIFAFTLNAFIMACVFQLFHLLKKKLGDQLGYFALITTWIGFEFLHHYWELSWPWLTLGNAFSIQTEIIQWYSVLGVSGGSLWILIVNFLGFRLLENRIIKKQSWKQNGQKIAIYFTILFLPMFISLYMYTSYKEKTDEVEIVVVQPNIDPYNEKFVSGVDSQIKKICDLADKRITKNTSIVIAPETAISWPFYEEELTFYPFYNYLLKRKHEWGKISIFTGASTGKVFSQPNSRASKRLVGGPGYYESYNSSLLINESDKHEFLHKSKLVLGVEKVPFSDWFPMMEEFSINNGGTSGTLGVEKVPKTLQTERFRFAPLICYESIYGQFCAVQCSKGAEIIFVITNDGWWKDTPGYKQHMSFSRLRAIENRRSVARSANTGTSCFIDQRGDVIQSTSWWEPDAIKETVNLNRDLTFFTKFGDLTGSSSVFATVLLILLALYYRVKRAFSN